MSSLEYKTCQGCSATIPSTAKFCSQCGKAQPPFESEMLIGGLVSSNLSRGMTTGYEIYVTTRRIIGVKPGFLGSLAHATHRGGGLAGSTAGLILSKSDPRSLQEIEPRKDFDATKQEITRMSLERPGNFRDGSLTIQTHTSNYLIKVKGEKDFQKLNKLLEGFLPRKSIDNLLSQCARCKGQNIPGAKTCRHCGAMLV